MREKRDVVRIFVISPDSDLTPELLYRYMVNQKMNLKMKETCFGLIVVGDEKSLAEALHEVKKLDKYGIFSKVRGYPPGDPRICRASRGGGPRMGFHFLEYEFSVLPLIREGLESVERGEEVRERHVEERVSVKEVEKAFREVEL